MIWAVLWLACSGGSGRGPDKDDTDTDTDTEDPTCTDSPVVTIGTGERRWEDLGEGDTLTMVHGPQGGWHMVASARVENTGDRVVLEYRISDDETGTVLADNSYYVGLIAEDTCSGYYPGMYAYLSIVDLVDGDCDTPPEILTGRTLRIDMTAEDDVGRKASASLKIIAAPDASDDPTCQ